MVSAGELVLTSAGKIYFGLVGTGIMPQCDSTDTIWKDAVKRKCFI